MAIARQQFVMHNDEQGGDESQPMQGIRHRQSLCHARPLGSARGGNSISLRRHNPLMTASRSALHRRAPFAIKLFAVQHAGNRT
jgi:hypothetical protein